MSLCFCVGVPSVAGATGTGSVVFSRSLLDSGIGGAAASGRGFRLGTPGGGPLIVDAIYL